MKKGERGLIQVANIKDHAATSIRPVTEGQQQPTTATAARRAAWATGTRVPRQAAAGERWGNGRPATSPVGRSGG
ncbi:hypothetical protein PAHAL_8G229100 [Panicum hallii]|uniref:Uncharacterized protein n=1 Tax=Panicum hallii TaxID=206008 RepID=A0A2T8IA05_9POAL|nr:hypothetical protein PAHAL_8G229100 [Panicum hallii]